ncbi:MAG: AAA family ATPase [Thermoplasmata archaeon]|nr:AAA family ATPase [Thermoplasmata archaeon]MBE3141226.1 AAA family ATPase [Thermoplasmata archaeon]
MAELICMDFNRHLKEMEKQGRCVFLPFEIQSLHLKNIGKFIEKNIEFNKFNIIQGHIGSGKTTIIKSIAGISGAQSLLKSEQNNGEINVTASDGRRHHQDICEAGDAQCIVLDDDVGEVLDSSHYARFLNYLRDLNVQVILTRGNMTDELNGLINRTFPDCRFIRLN